MSGSLPYQVDIEAPINDVDGYSGWENETAPRTVAPHIRADIRELSAAEAFQMMGVVSRVNTLIIVLDRDDIYENYKVIHGNSEYLIDQVIRPKLGRGRLMEIYATERRRAHK